jgi:hypothetical protein
MASQPTLNHTTFLLTLSSALPLTLLLLGLALLPLILARRPRAPTSSISLALASTGAIALAGIAGLAAIAGGGASAGAAGGAFGLLGVLLREFGELWLAKRDESCLFVESKDRALTLNSLRTSSG